MMNDEQPISEAANANANANARQIRVEIGDESSVRRFSSLDLLQRNSAPYLRFSELVYAKYPTVPGLVNALNDCVRNNAAEMPSDVLDLMRTLFIDSHMISIKKEHPDAASLIRYYLSSNLDANYNTRFWKEISRAFFHSLWNGYYASHKHRFRPEAHAYQHMSDDGLLLETPESIVLGNMHHLSYSSYCEVIFYARLRMQAPTVASLISEIMKQLPRCTDLPQLLKECEEEYTEALAVKYKDTRINEFHVDHEPVVYVRQSDTHTLTDALLSPFARDFVTTVICSLSSRNNTKLMPALSHFEI